MRGLQAAAEEGEGEEMLGDAMTAAGSAVLVIDATLAEEVPGPYDDDDGPDGWKKIANRTCLVLRFAISDAERAEPVLFSR